ncbi:16S rRNA (cytosine967-C5)-methyltransferase [Acinetobacter calcoaceticus]|uniref:16S rRNA (cytosine(967)-C(5))-methyltransferase n=1 Tax=Acinetobacter calcoaceticus TaxID=471 RepID=A0A4R1XNM7_ACICA|nr:16S rRNA (cytosine967-C5)-methyltransferase [Acinetobacter calcoaceticus]
MNHKSSNAAEPNLRAHVVMCLLTVQQGKSLSSFLSRELNDVPTRDRALFHELLLGTLRQWYALKSISLPLLVKPLDNPKVESCLYLGIYQLLATRIPAHAAISETVDATKQLGFESLSGVVNAILRRVSRETEAFQTALAEAHGLPSWMFKRLKKDWPEQLPELCQNLKQVAPLTIRVNQRHIGRDDYLEQLHALDIAAHACSISETGIVLDQGGHIPDLLGFEDGWFSVQDEHAQLAVQILPELNQKSLLDACAAPGGKTAHLLEKFDLKHLIALDNDAKRLERVYENLDRLQLNDCTEIDVVTADACTWVADEALDCIILDAPCSATGVLRRHPDIRLLRQTTDIPVTVALQKQILAQMWQQLKPGGVLLYITCSIFKAENEQQMQAFFAEHTDATEIKIEADWGIEQCHGRQLLPQPGQGDGFYYCLISKNA